MLKEFVTKLIVKYCKVLTKIVVQLLYIGIQTANKKYPGWINLRNLNKKKPSH